MARQSPVAMLLRPRFSILALGVLLLLSHGLLGLTQWLQWREALTADAVQAERVGHVIRQEALSCQARLAAVDGLRTDTVAGASRRLQLYAQLRVSPNDDCLAPVLGDRVHQVLADMADHVAEQPLMLRWATGDRALYDEQVAAWAAPVRLALMR